MRPDVAEVTAAREALVAWAEAQGGAVRFKGRMLEAPMVKRYAAIVAMAENHMARNQTAQNNQEKNNA